MSKINKKCINHECVYVKRTQKIKSLKKTDGCVKLNEYTEYSRGWTAVDIRIYEYYLKNLCVKEPMGVYLCVWGHFSRGLILLLRTESARKWPLYEGSLAYALHRLISSSIFIKMIIKMWFWLKMSGLRQNYWDFTTLEKSMRHTSVCVNVTQLYSKIVNNNKTNEEAENFPHTHPYINVMLTRYIAHSSGCYSKWINVSSVVPQSARHPHIHR